MSGAWVNARERRKRLRGILAGDQCVYAAPVHDPISARIADLVGFEVGFIADSSIPTSLLCVPPDTGLLTMTEHAGAVRDMCRVSDISLIVGVHDGYGHALNVMRTVEEMEASGASAIRIEDIPSVLKFGNPGVAGNIESSGLPMEVSARRVRARKDWFHALIPLDEMVGRLKAAIAARQDPNMLVVPRCFALRLADLTKSERWREFVTRVKAYEQAGVDAIFVATTTSRGRQDQMELIEALDGVTTLPLMGGHTFAGKLGLGSQEDDKKYLASKGFRVMNPPHYALYAQTKAVFDTLQGLRNGVSADEWRATHFDEELQYAVLPRGARYDELIRTYMRPQESRVS